MISVGTHRPSGKQRPTLNGMNLESEEDLEPGRYAAIDVGTNSVLLLAADVSRCGGLRPVLERAAITRLGEGLGRQPHLQRAAMERTLGTIRDFVRLSRSINVHAIAIVGTAVLRDAVNGPDFAQQVMAATGVPMEIISGAEEAELAFAGNRGDDRLPKPMGERVIVDIGGGSTEIVRGTVEGTYHRESYRTGAVCLTERYLASDPPSLAECEAAQQAIEAALGTPELLPPRAVLLGTGGTVLNLASMALAGGMISGPEVHGALLSHGCVAELLDLLRYMPVEFRRRCPGLEPARADIILAGAMILHQVMGLLSAPSLTVTANGIRHGCIYALARRHFSLR
ncbi:MAG: Ppx/GppA family phosphatase [Armatimonadetes bacterium]|nr:Ppx/GppA family phosphatase [Armatimonadota bacterium]